MEKGILILVMLVIIVVQAVVIVVLKRKYRRFQKEVDMERRLTTATLTRLKALIENQGFFCCFLEAFVYYKRASRCSVCGAQHSFQ